jgi:hypothetical protein
MDLLLLYQVKLAVDGLGNIMRLDNPVYNDRKAGVLPTYLIPIIRNCIHRLTSIIFVKLRTPTD